MNTQMTGQRPMNKATVLELTALYKALEKVDTALASMMTPLPGHDVVQSVTFYMHSPCFSGSYEYRPKHCGGVIAAALINEMRVERDSIVAQITAHGFTCPPEPKAA